MQQSISKKRLQKYINNPEILLTETGTTSLIPVLSREAARNFPLRVPKGFVDRIKKGNPDDPLLKQVLPIEEEERSTEGFTTDPLDEQKFQASPGLLHKYHGRALLVTTGACAIHCRYCFRRHFPYSASNPSSDQWHQALKYLEKDESIREIILSGGDPLSLADSRLTELISKLSDIPHILRLRIHTRMPIVLPERVHKDMLRWLTRSRLRPILVVHANHANELDNKVADAMDKLHQAYVPIFNQSVLLKGINDSVDALTELSERLFDIRVIPYYLHMLDPVKGTAHFNVDEADAAKILRQLNKKLPGYLVPKLVREITGARYKIPVELATRNV